jgi:antagonist of KipI
VTLRIVGAGLLTTVQDLGRPNHQRQGIPVGGAMDRMALRVGNALIGNEEGAAALEATLVGPTIAFERAVLIAITGADLEATVDGRRIPTWHPVCVPRGATLRFGKAAVGCRAYIALAGGIEVPPVFGSRSTYLRASFGGYEGRALRVGDVVDVGEPSALSRAIGDSVRGSAPSTATVSARGETNSVVVARWSAGVTLRPRYSSEPVVRLVAGAHTDALARESRAALAGSSFRVSASSDRMGYRLEGQTLALRRPMELLSEAVTFGTVQLPPGGAPIVLMADRQTTGGYPRIGEVASIDLPLIAQLKPGDRLRFRLVSLEHAQRWYLAEERELAQARAGIAFRFSKGRS